MVKAAIPWFALVYLALAMLHYPGCMGYWQTKYPSDNRWDDRAFCVMMTVWPGGPVIIPFLTGFYNRGFQW